MKLVTFFEHHLDKVDWYGLSANESIQVSFFEQHLYKVVWRCLSRNTSIPVSFFELHLDKVRWEVLSDNTSIPVSFFKQHLDEIDWYKLSSNNFSIYIKNVNSTRIQSLWRGYYSRKRLHSRLASEAIVEWFYNPDCLAMKLRSAEMAAKYGLQL